MHAILGQKKEQTQKFREDGKRIPVTIVEVANNPVLAVKTMDKNGYWAIQLGYGTNKKPNKPLAGHIKGATEQAPRFLREVRFAKETTADTMPKVGDFIALGTVLAPGDVIDVTGISKGKGFAGGVKRHGFHGGPKTHGQSDRHRAPGSIGSGTTPGRVYKGKRMAGKMGFAQVTVRNLVVADVDGTTLLIDGVIPGALNGLVMITKKGEDKKFVALIGAKKAEQQAEIVEEVPAEVNEAVVEVPEEKVLRQAQDEAEEIAVAEDAKAEEASIASEETSEVIEEPAVGEEAKEEVKTEAVETSAEEKTEAVEASEVAEEKSEEAKEEAVA